MSPPIFHSKRLSVGADVPPFAAETLRRVKRAVNRKLGQGVHLKHERSVLSDAIPAGFCDVQVRSILQLSIAEGRVGSSRVSLLTTK